VPLPFPEVNKLQANARENARRVQDLQEKKDAGETALFKEKVLREHAQKEIGILEEAPPKSMPSHLTSIDVHAPPRHAVKIKKRPRKLNAKTP